MISRARSSILGISLAAACVACSGGRGKADAGATTGSAGSGGAAVAGAGGDGTGGGPGAGGGGATGTCAFDVQHQPSPAIGTVEIVTFSVDLASPTEVQIDFGPTGAPPTMTAPVDLSEPMHRTVLVGMKGQKPYTFRIVATAGTKTCTSADFSFTTGAVPANAPKIQATKTTPGAGAKGFIVTTYGLRGPGVDDPMDAFIFDTDGDIVWWSPASLDANMDGVSRSHLTWDAKAIWILASRTGGQLLRVSIDGETITDYRDALTSAHHDFAPLPDGSIALLRLSEGLYSVVEMTPGGTITPVVDDVTTLYQGGAYTNAIHYYPADDTYTLSDAAQSLFIKFRRDGTLVWQLGGSNPFGKSFRLVGLSQWYRNHGHQLTPDGRFLFFNNQDIGTEPAAVWEVLLDEAAGTATKTWEYHFTDLGRDVAFGDAERLPNGNALLTHVGGVIREVDRSGAIVQSFTNTSYGFGFADFRTSLYGPPPR
jgi:hypothetical protein